MFILVVIFCITAVFYLLKRHFEYWERLGVPGPKPRLIVGNVGESLIMRKSMGEIFTDIYRDYPGKSLIGIYEGVLRSIMVCDPDLIREITVKSFHNFRDNSVDVDKDIDPLFGRNPFFLNGEEWKSARNILTPCFTSGKMKAIYPLIEEISRQLVAYIDKEPDATNGNGLEAKELCTKFTLNNVASCAFGLDGKCFEDPNSEFRDLARRFFSFSVWDTIKFYIMFLVPPLVTILKLKILTKDVEDQLMGIVMQTLKYRKENNIVRNDFLHFMNQIKETNPNFTDVDVTAQAVSFFGDGYETSAQVMSFLLYHIANNPKEQETLRQEVDKAYQENDNSLPYEVLQGLPYLDAVLSESLRLTPPFYALMKKCTNPYTFISKTGDGLVKPSVSVERETHVIIPVYGLHRDPKYFEDPERFDPDRFIGSNREKIVKYTYLPFGEGPRACLGQRFGMMQIKAGVAYIVKNYEMTVNNKTSFPLKMDPANFFLMPLGGLWINYKKIEQDA